MNHSSYVFWQDSTRVAIATGLVRKSANRKTGAMVQTYILLKDTKPSDAVSTGADKAICGDCPLRPSVATGKQCYVNTGWLTKLWHSYRSGRIPAIPPATLGDLIESTGLPVRQGAYGDPAIVPTHVWVTIDRGRGTSYTHQWEIANLAHFAMASVQTVQDAQRARLKGYRTYRIDLDGIGPQADEIECPNATRNVTCAQCGLCNGNRSGAKNLMVSPL